MAQRDHDGRGMENGNGGMGGKVVMVTGGTGGIGKATATGLARMGATVVVVGRDEGRGKAAVEDIKTNSGNPSVELMLADLLSQAQVRRLVGEFLEKHDRLNVLVNNAGGQFPRRRETEDGIEATLAANHLASFLLAHLLLPALEAGAPARVVNVNAISPPFASLDLDDLQTRGRRYGPISAYGRAKTASLICTYEMARRLASAGTGVTVNAANPGSADTEMSRAAGGPEGPWIMRAMAPVMGAVQSRIGEVDKAARSSIYLASSPEVEGVTGRYFDHKARPARSAKVTHDESKARRLWEITARLVGLEGSSGPPRLLAEDRARPEGLGGGA